MKFELTILGANSATPAFDRFPSSFVLNYCDRLYLIDCGEGAQMKMSQYKVKHSRINKIFISHLHGDHVFGLPGLLNSMSLNNRQKSLQIIGPQGIKGFIEDVASHTFSHFGYPINYVEIDSDQPINVVDLPDMNVTAFPLRHRVPTYGYLFREKIVGYNISTSAIDKYDLSIDEIKIAKSGQNINRQDRIIPYEEVTLSPAEKRSFAYCSDTVFDSDIVKYISGVNLLYHEATYTHDLQRMAVDRMHSTAREAAIIARDAEVKKLVIGHYSSRYRDLSVLLDEARSIFPNTELAIGGSAVEVGKL